MMTMKVEETVEINKFVDKFSNIDKIKEKLRNIKNSIPPIVFYVMFFVFLFIFIFVAVFYFLQDVMLFLPDHPSNSRTVVDNPSSHGLPYENIFLTTRDGVRLHAYLIMQAQPDFNQTFTLIYFHGNAGNIGHRLENVEQLYNRCSVNIFLLDYRGYGKSQGTPSEYGLLIDAATAIEFISNRSDINDKKTILFGRSLGGAVAIGTAYAFANSKKVAGLIVENTFTSIIDMARSIFKIPIFFLIPNFLIRNKFLSIEKICEVKVPSLFISGLEDELVPSWMMRSLYEMSKSIMKRLYLCKSGKHNDTWHCSDYYEMIVRFLQEINRFQDGGKVKPSQEVTSRP